MASCDETARGYPRTGREPASRVRGDAAAAARESGQAGEPDPDAAADRGATEPSASPDSCTDWLAAVLPPPPARILDAGCGEGTLSAWLAGLGYQVTAIDADAAAVAAARASGVPAVQADLARYDDEPFDAVVMLLSLHHVHPLATAMDRIARLVRPGGLLILDEFAWDWAGHATIRWFFDIAAILAAAGVTEPLPDGADLMGRWRSQHVRSGALCNRGTAMIEAVSARFCDVSVQPVPFLTRHLLAGHDNQRVFAEVHRIERRCLADGTLSATGFRLIARKKPS